MNLDCEGLEPRDTLIGDLLDTGAFGPFVGS